MEERTDVDRYGGLKTNISRLIEQKMKKYKITGCSISLVDGIETVWSQGFGYADKENNIKATAQTRYLIGSTTKLFTGTAVMQLVDRGKLDIDKPVVEYIPEFSVKTRIMDAAPITVRNLMTHHSGLPCDNFDKFYNKNPDESINTFRKDIDYLKEHHASYPPNYIWSYSNLGTALLGVIVERVSDTDYCQFVRENILKSLQMNNSSTVNQKGIKETMAKTYNKGLFEEEYFLRDIPSGSVVSTVEDMASFIKMVLGHGSFSDSCVLKKASLEEMLTVQNKDVALDNGFKMGLNWFLEWPYFEHAGKVCWHDGSSVHYNSLLLILPEQKLGITLLSNSTTALPVFFREIAEETLDEALKLKGHVRKNELKNSDSSKTYGADLTEYEGTFTSIMGTAVIKNYKNKLKLKMMGMNFTLIPNDDGWYGLRLELLGLVPINIKKLQNLRVRVQRINNERVFAVEQRASKHKFRQNIGREYIKKDVLKAWKNRVGKYEALDKENTFFNTLKFSYTDGILSIKTNTRKVGSMNVVLDSVSDSEAIIAGLGRFAGDTVYIRNENGNEVLELLGLKFVKCAR